METIIRKCTLEDLELLQKIGTETYNETYSHLNTPENMNEYLEQAFDTEQLKVELSNPSSIFLFQYVDDMLAGYLKLNQSDAQTHHVGEDAMEIERIYVRSLFHERGLGKALLHTAIETAREHNKKEIWLGIWRKNKNAIDFHKSMGFEAQGTYSIYIGDEEQTNYVMVKELK